MKLLVLQLARFGDIYLSWPILRALRRQNPGAEIHLLVRERFMAATEGLGCGIVVHKLPTADILAPLAKGIDGLESVNFSLEEWTDDLSSGNWDRIINLSFSPSSSYLVDILAQKSTEVSGYRRHSDGFLAIPDDASAYFYAQVGPRKHNRLHLVDLFAMIAKVELQETDWFVDADLSPSARSPYIVVHLAASQDEKCYPIASWKSVIEHVVASGFGVVLIGSADEAHLAAAFMESRNIENRIGKTRLPELFPILKDAVFLIGADSAPIHMSALVGTPVLNLSFDAVSFWETGPLSRRSLVVKAGKPAELLPATVIGAIREITRVSSVASQFIQSTNEMGPRFHLPNEVEDFSWNLIRALYMQNDFPHLPQNPVLHNAVQRLFEACELAREQFETLTKNRKSKTAIEILESIDVMLKEISRLSPALSPVIDWFETERLRIPPGRIEETIERSASLFRDLATICKALQRPLEPDVEELRQAGLDRLREMTDELPSCAEAFRFFHLAEAEPKLVAMLDHLSYFLK